MTSPIPPDIDQFEQLHQRVCEILIAAQTGVARTVNTAQVLPNQKGYAVCSLFPNTELLNSPEP